MLVGIIFGGPGAMGTTLLVFTGEVAVWALFEVVPWPTEPVDFGDSESVPLTEVGVDTGVWAREFFRDDFLDARDEEPATGAVPLPRLRFLMTSVLSDKGRTTPCSLRNKPHALQRGWPSGLRRQRGVVWVKQLVQVVGALPCSPCLVPPGLAGREGAAELKPDSGGVLGDDCEWPCIPWRAKAAALGVELVRGIF
jgi:hypothetical protein